MKTIIAIIIIALLFAAPAMADEQPTRPEMKPATYTATAHASPPKATQTPYPAPYPAPISYPYPEPETSPLIVWLLELLR